MVRTTRRGRARAPEWSLYRDEELLRLRFSDLRLRIEGSRLEPLVRRLQREIERKGLAFRPHVWLSSTWFSPDGVPGFAIPFFLAHPRLMRLEHARIGSVEGGDEEECMRLMRHEAAHALNTAYGLHRRRRTREVFGRYSEPYRAEYRPDPLSTDHVRNLDGWYAQSHPAEDFAETFAVWLRPGSNWRERHAGWGALAKLEFLDAELRAIGDAPPRTTLRERTELLSSLRTTLAAHYKRKSAMYARGPRTREDPALLSIFSRAGGSKRAAPFLRRHRRRLLRAVVRRTRGDVYAADQMLKRLAARCFELDLRVSRPLDETRTAAASLLAAETLVLMKGRRPRYYR